MSSPHKHLIDGFNLYYGLLKSSSCKWLNLDALTRKYIDLSEPLRIITQEPGKKVGILNPQAKFGYEPIKYAMFKKRILQNVVASCQYPNPMSDQH